MVRYFGTAITTVTTLLTLCLLGFMASLVLRRDVIVFWGRRTLLLFFWGLLVCCLAATRDRFDQSVQHVIDGTTAPGLFPLLGVTSVIAMALAAVICLSGLLSIFLRNQKAREVLCFLMMGGVTGKILLVEISRIFQTARL